MTQPAGPPDISILMTVYNTVDYLQEAIRSVVAQQTSLRWELLIVDDGSTDGSDRVAGQFAAAHPGCIRLLRHPRRENRGISASRNLALREARAPRIAFLDSDDVWLPGHLETVTGALDGCPQAAMVYAGAERWVYFDRAFDEDAARTAEWGDNYLPPLFPAESSSGPGVREADDSPTADFIAAASPRAGTTQSAEPVVHPRARLLRRGELLEWFRADESLTPCICSVLVRAEAARAVGGFCDAFRGLYDDQAFHAKMSLRFPILALDACVARYRQHDRSCCARARVQAAERQCERERFAEFLRHEVDAVQELAAQ